MNRNAELPHPTVAGSLGIDGSPFHAVVDQGLYVVRVGRSLRKLLGPTFVTPMPLGDVIRLLRPVAELELGAILGLEGTPLVVECLATRAILRASVVPAPEARGFVLFASPWITSSDELVRLGLTVDDFAPHDPIRDLLEQFDRKSATIAQLKSANDQLERTKKELEVSRARLDEAHVTSDAVVAQLGRSLRTPLGSLSGAIGLLLDSGLEAAQLDLLEALRLATRQMSLLVDDAVDFAELDSGQLKVADEPVSVFRVVDDALELLAEAASKKSLDFAGLIAPDVPDVLRSDRMRLGQIVSNLLREAVEQTQTGHVTLRVTTSDDAVQFAVEDSRPASSSARLQQLNRAGARDPADAFRRVKNIGMGLVLSAKLTELLGGTLSVEDSGDGSTRIALRLPLRGDDLRSTTKHETIEGRSLPLHGRRVIVFDESPTHASAVHFRLARLGAEVSRASDLDHLEVLASERAVDATFVGTYRSKDHARKLVKRLADIPGLFVCLPRGCEVADADIVQIARPARLAHLGRMFQDPSSPTISMRPSVDRSELSVLVAEDELLNQRIVSLMLEHLGVRPVVVSDGRSAVEEVERGDFDLVLMDLQMPEMDGIEALEMIRRSHVYRPMVVAVTASSSAEERALCLAAGADGVLTKPLEASSLEEVLVRVARRPRIG